MTYRELLATRVLSVNAYWQELRGPSRHSPREIPVPLWPGENLEQYEREFVHWLTARRLSLVSMRDDPATERNCRLQFAQTRVARPNSNVQRRPSSPPRYHSRSGSPSSPPRGAPYYSRSRSPSRSPPRNRRFIGSHQLPLQREDRSVSPRYVYERNPSPERGRIITARPAAVPDRNYQMARGYSAAPESSWVYGNWPPQRSVELRPRQDPRPSPGAAHRQYSGDAQRWTRSRSRSPENYEWYMKNRPLSPQRSDRPVPRRSPSPHDQSRSHIDNLRKHLLARRVVSVKAFRAEMCKLRNGLIREDSLKRPHETMVRIPVLLWPGETMAQYTQKFERWLDSRKMSLSSLRDNPAKERSLWHTFAYARAGASDLTEPAQSNAPVRSPTSQRTHSRSRSRSRSSSRSTRGNSERGRPITPTGGYSRNKPMQRGSVPTAVSLPQRDRSLSPDRRDRSRSPPASLAPPENPHLLINKTRSQLLERRLLELAAFQKEIEQNGANATDGNTLVAIPVPLLPGESMGLYDHRFWTWAKSYSESKEVMKDNPARERRLRIAFAYLRANRPQSSTVAGAQDARTSAESQNTTPRGALKRPSSAINSQRPADSSGRKTPVTSVEPSTKRTRTQVEQRPRISMTPGGPSNCLSAEPQVKQEPTLVESNRPSSGSNLGQTTTTAATASTARLVPTTDTPAVRVSVATRPTSAPTSNAPVRASTVRAGPVPTAIASSKGVHTAARASSTATPNAQVPTTARTSPITKANPPLKAVPVAARTSSVPTTTGPSTRTATTSSPGKSVRFSTSTTLIPETMPARPLPSPSATAPSIKREKALVPSPAAIFAPKTTTKHPSTSRTQGMAERNKNATRPRLSDSSTSQEASRPSSVPGPATSSSAASAVSTGSQRMRASTSATSASLPNPVVKPATFSLPSSAVPMAHRLGTRKTVESSSSGPRASQEASRPQLPSVTFPSVLSPVEKSPRFSFISAVPAVSMASQASTPTTSQRQTSSSADTSSAIVTTSSVVASPPSADASNSPAAATSRVNVIEHHSADTEPDTGPAELSVAESNATDDSEEHDGDVMNEDGCCCNKCMRNWAKTLTDRMDQLERNVGDLKREVNSAQTMTASGS
ncbi:hypothetical protein GN244_ATG09979 [Phytophthora infestans]|uniref:Uncharacterized protein n=1 Tax=Phytophthora infestans TaxID=4787 RepID=A0A833WD50_PHYIN|nr:hypothetical protein GN244_ATG09979 [Phytophthora infestans]KAF4134217.1 hypothetical protein GN958_ATG16598 [Phytophthora infestans]